MQNLTNFSTNTAEKQSMTKTVAPEMTIAEFREQIAAFEKSVGPWAQVYVTLCSNKDPYGKVWGGSLYVNGVVKGQAFLVHADSLSDLYRMICAEWDKQASNHRTVKIRKMALSIIAVTADTGSCSDAALRAHGDFTQSEIDQYGADACAQANDIAGRGPFEIRWTRGANAPAAAA